MGSRRAVICPWAVASAGAVLGLAGASWRVTRFSGRSSCCSKLTAYCNTCSKIAWALDVSYGTCLGKRSKTHSRLSGEKSSDRREGSATEYQPRMSFLLTRRNIVSTQCRLTFTIPLLSSVAHSNFPSLRVDCANLTDLYRKLRRHIERSGGNNVSKSLLVLVGSRLAH